jgi:hypothetical protein
MDEWIKKCDIHTIEYYSSLERREILTHAATCRNCEDVVLGKISQMQMEKYCLILLP